MARAHLESGSRKDCKSRKKEKKQTTNRWQNEEFEEDLRNLRIMQWEENTEDTNSWRSIVEK